MSSKCFITFLNTTAQTEHSGFNPKTLPAVCAPLRAHFCDGK
jgi:hypothetical protein